MSLNFGVEYSCNVRCFQTIQVLPGETSVTLPQLVPNTEYQIQIQGVVNDGDVREEHNTVEMDITTGLKYFVYYLLHLLELKSNESWVYSLDRTYSSA